MAKNRMSAVEVKDCVDKAEEAAEFAQLVAPACNSCKIDLSSDNALTQARRLLSCSRIFSEAASALLSHYTLELGRDAIKGKGGNPL